MKVLQVHLSESQHKKLRVMSAERCVAMSELVRWWIDGNIAVVGAVPAVDLRVGKVVLGEAEGEPLKPQKPVKEASKAMTEALDKVAPKRVVVSGLPLEEPVSQFQCKICGKPTKGEFVCQKCKNL